MLAALTWPWRRVGQPFVDWLRYGTPGVDVPDFLVELHRQ